MDFENGKDADYAAEINVSAMAEPEIKVDEPLPPDPAGAALCVTSGFALLAGLRFNKATESFNLALKYDPNSADAYLGLLLADNLLRTSVALTKTKTHFWESKYYKPLCKLASPLTLALLKENRARIEAEEERIRAVREARREKTRAFMKKHRAAISICSILLIVAATLTSMFFAGVFGDPTFVGGTVTYTFDGAEFKLQKTDRESYEIKDCSVPTSVTALRLPNTYRDIPITSIGDSAFRSCNSLTGVTIGNGVTSIGNYAFQSCDNLTNVTIGNGVTSIGYSAFEFCSSLTSVTIPDSVTSIGDDAFQYCYSLAGVTIGNGVTSIGDGAFHNCDRLTSVTIPDSVTSIGNSAFEACYSLTGVTIGNGVTSIGSSAFANCSSLTSVTIPDSVTSIGEGAFYNCNALYTEYEHGRYIGDDNNPYALLYELTNKNFTTYKIHEQTKIIGYGVFERCGSLSTITIPDSVTSIGNNAFYNCSSLTGVTIPDGVTSIGSSAFASCDSLTGVTIGNGVTSIGDWAFYNCYSLTGVTIPDSVTSIGNSAFNGCYNLETVYYNGTADEWGEISIGYNNSYLKNATRYYYSESEPTEEGDYWHYVDGVPTKW